MIRRTPKSTPGRTLFPNTTLFRSVLELQKRAIKFIDEKIDLNEDTVLVTHWGVINTILSYYFSNGLDSYWKFSVENGGIVVIEFLDGYPILKGLNIGG